MRPYRFILLLALLMFVICCGCSKTDGNDCSNSIWYTCSSYSVPAVDGYEQFPYSTIYSNGYYYLTVFGHKTNDNYEETDEYYKLYKIDSQGQIEVELTLPTECAGRGNQIIIDNKLYCVGKDSNVSFVVDTSDGSIISEDYHNEPIIGFFDSTEGYIMLTRSKIIRYSMDGSETGTIDLSNIENYYFKRPVYEKDGVYYLIEDSSFGMNFYELDFESSRADLIFECNGSDSNGFDFNGDIAFSSIGVYTLSFDDGTMVPLTEWNYVDVKPAYKNTIDDSNVSYGNSRFGKIYIYNDYEIEGLIFTQADEEDYNNRTKITIGGYGVSLSLPIKWAIYNYNTTQDEYRVFIDDYWYSFPFTTGIEAQTQTIQLIQYFNEGNAPDIYYGEFFDYRYFYNAGMVRNMMPLIESDPDFSMDDLIPSIKDSVADDDVCYQLYPSFIFNGDFGLESIYGDGDVTYSMIADLSSSTGLSIQGDIQSAEIADQIIRYSMDDLVRNSTDNHVLSVEELTGIVEYAVNNGIPYTSIENNIADMRSVHDGQYLKCRRFLYNIYDIADIEYTLNDRFIYLGFPSVYGASHVAHPDGLVAISSDTDYPEVCWDIIKYMFSEDVQKIEITQNYNPVIVSVYEDYCFYAENPDAVPENDHLWNSITVGRSPVPSWIIEDYQSMVNSIDSVTSYDWGLYNLICDEVNTYDTQGKTPKEIAESLQSRIDLYVAENYG